MSRSSTSLRCLAHLVAVATALLVACREPPAPRHAPAPEGEAPSSNVLRSDFVGSARCEPCHQDIYRRWQSSPMHRMTRSAERPQLRAPFDGQTFVFKDDTARMLEKEGDYYIRFGSELRGESVYRLTKVIGGRYREDYVGESVPFESARQPGRGDARILPVSYLLWSGEWRYKGYSVMSAERPHLARGPVWRKSCSFCHNTTPWLTTLYDELLGARAVGYQGAVNSDLPAERRLAFTINDESALVRALEEELQATGMPLDLPGDAEAALQRASRATRDHYGASELSEQGIGCEACHGGGRAHIADPARVRSDFAPQSASFEVSLASSQPLRGALAESHACARCHSVLFSRYPYTWEGGERGQSPGGSSINSGEARNFLLGDCTTELRCSHCHDAHAEDNSDRLRALRTPAGNRVCLNCHEQYKDERRLKAHTHHAPDGVGSACLSCHMAQKNTGLDYRLTTYHRIGSPTDEARVYGDRPLECALCHADKTVLELSETMERWYKKTFDRALLQTLYGDDLRVNVLSATFERGKPHEQGVASFVAGEQRRREALDHLIAQLNNPVPLMRFFAHGALEKIHGAPLAVDLHARGVEIVRQARTALAD